MEIGVFAKIIKRPRLSEVFETIRRDGFSTVQFNMTCVGLPSLPDEIAPHLLLQIKEELFRHRLSMAALSGTFNMVHPDVKLRKKNMEKLLLLLSHCRTIGTPVVTLCTGTRNPDDMWTAHPDNHTRDAWLDLCKTLEPILSKAEEEQVIVAFEPEISNVVNSARKGKQLIDEMKSPSLKVVFDAANLFEHATVSEVKKYIAEGIDMLGEHIVLVHAKDRTAEGKVIAAGKGIIPFDFYLQTLKNKGIDVPLVAHGMEEDECPGCFKFLQRFV